MVHTHPRLILGAPPGVGPSRDPPGFTPAMRRAAGLVAIDTASGGAGCDAERDRRLRREELGVRRAAIRLDRRNAGRRRPETPCRRAMRKRFERELHNQRWHAGSGFSRHKRRLGSALAARGREARRRELVLRVVTHNLVLLAGSRSAFQQSKTV